MSLIQILNYSQKKEFETPPLLEYEIRQEIFSVSPIIKQQIESIEINSNKVRFIAMYGYFKVTQTFYNPNLFHLDDLNYICKRYHINFDPNHIFSKNTMALYKKIIRYQLGYKPVDSTLKDLLLKTAINLITQIPSPKALFYTLIELAIEHRYEVPSYTLLSKIITDAMNKQRGDIFGKLKLFSHNEELQALQRVLEVDETLPGRYILSKFKKLSHSLKPSKIKEEVKLFETIKNYHNSILDITQKIGLEENTAKHYAQWVEKSDMHQILRKEKHKQQFDLICFMVHHTKVRNDQLCDILLQSVQSAKLSAMREHQNTYFLERASRSKASLEITSLLKDNFIPKLYSIQNTLKLKISSDKKLELISKEIETMLAAKEEKKTFLDSHEELEDHIGYHAILEKRSRKLQNRVAQIVKVLEFDENESDKSLLKAITHFKNTNGVATAQLPIEFLNDIEKNGLLQNNVDEPFRISLYKVFLFIAIADGIKSGALNLKYSYRYRAFNAYLLDAKLYEANKEEYLKHYNIEFLQDSNKLMQDQQADLGNAYKTTNENIINGINIYFHSRPDGSFVVHTPKVEKLEDEDTIGPYLPKEKFIPLIDVLRHIDQLVSFNKKFLHHSKNLHHRLPKHNALYAAIIGYGCNISIPKMGKISKGITVHDIDHIKTWYLSADMLQEANDMVLLFTQNLEVPKLFHANSQINHTASDGQKFNLSVDSLNSGYSFKYFGLGRGVSRYSFVDEAHRITYTTVINANEREAAYVIDGLMHNDVIKSDIHSTDTFGYSEIIFGLTHLLGLMFAPRIKNFKEQQLYAFEAKKTYRNKGYIVLPVKQINIQIIEEQWDQILRLVITIKERRVSASQLLKRLTSYSRKHKLYQALREFGRIIKTRFLLNYIDDVVFRQQIEKQLNKIENVNRFSKAIFFGNSGEYFYANKEEQDIASNSLTLIQNSIICWNYLYFSNLLVKEKDLEQQQKLTKALKNGSIVHWQHINFYGEYDFTDKPIEDEFDMDAIKALSLPITDSEN